MAMNTNARNEQVWLAVGSLMILAAGVLGGMHTVYGALLGAALMTLGPMSSSAFEDYSFVVFGLFRRLGAGGSRASAGDADPGVVDRAIGGERDHRRR